MTEIKDRIAAIDAFGRELAAAVNERIEAEKLVGQSPATMRRVEELIAAAQAEWAPAVISREGEGHFVVPEDFDFHVIGKGITARPFVSPCRYTGKVGL